jgi:hypothetical protein
MNAEHEVVEKPAVPDWWPAQPPGRVAILAVASVFIVYLPIWLWRVTRALGTVWGRFRNPGWRTLGLFVPVYGLVLIWQVFDETRKRLSEVGLRPVMPPWLFFTVWFVGMALLRSEDAVCLLGAAVAAGALAAAQHDVNRLFQTRCRAGRRFAPWRAADWAVAILGGLFWLVMMLAAALE